jgi:Hyccin
MLSLPSTESISILSLSHSLSHTHTLSLANQVEPSRPVVSAPLIALSKVTASTRNLVLEINLQKVTQAMVFLPSRALEAYCLLALRLLGCGYAFDLQVHEGFRRKYSFSTLKGGGTLSCRLPLLLCCVGFLFFFFFLSFFFFLVACLLFPWLNEFSLFFSRFPTHTYTPAFPIYLCLSVCLSLSLSTHTLSLSYLTLICRRELAHANINTCSARKHDSIIIVIISRCRSSHSLHRPRPPHRRDLR